MTLKIETGTASGQVDLVNKIYDFVDNNDAEIGWSAIDVRSFSSDRQATIRMDTACYFTFRSDVGNARPRFYFRPHTGYSSGAALTAQPNGPTDVNTHQKQNLSLPAASPFSYFFFADTNYFIFIFAIPGGWYQSGMCGRLELYGGAQNGIFTRGTIAQESAITNVVNDYSSTAVAGDGYMLNSLTGYSQIVGPVGRRVAANAGALGAMLDHGGSWIGFEHLGLASGTMARTGWAWDINNVNGLNANLPTLERVWDTSDVNIVAPLIPGVVFAPHPSLAGKFFPFGVIPGVWYINVRNAPSQSIITVGEDSYQVFPGRTRDVVNRLQYCGLAVKTVVEP